MQASTVLLR
jgi:hypothetical protein